jgi:hypothetical protein
VEYSWLESTNHKLEPKKGDRDGGGGREPDPFDQVENLEDGNYVIGNCRAAVLSPPLNKC